MLSPLPAAHLLTFKHDAMSLILQVVTSGRTHEYVRERTLRDGEVGTLDTLRAMSRMVLDGTRSEPVGRIVKGDIIKGARPHDDTDERDHAFRFWRDEIKWRRDPVGIERIADLQSTYHLRWGDCGAKSIGLATTFAHLGHTPYFMFMAQEPLNVFLHEYNFNHVYVAVFAAGQRIPYDPTPERARAAWEASATARYGYRIFPEAGKSDVWRIE
jgi:hypothetical protein